MAEAVFYKSNNNWEKKLQQIMESSLSNANKELIEHFSKRLVIEGISAGRIKKYLYIINELMVIAKKDFSKITKGKTGKKIRTNNLVAEDLENILIEINKRGYRYETKKEFKTCLKKFLKFIEGENYNPLKYAWIRLKNKKEEESSLKPDDLPTQKEIMQMLDKASPMMRALISMQTECAPRPSELLSLRIGSLTFKEKKTEITIEQSKTRRRLNWFYFADAYIRSWINQHPHKGDNTAPLFPSTFRGDKSKEYFTPAGYDKALQTLAENCGIKKRIFPYLLRHYGITSMRKRGFPDELIAKTVGHSIDMIKRYEHLSDPENEKRYDEQFEKSEKGMIVKGEELPYKICNICEQRNDKEVLFCVKCNIPLKYEAITQTENQKAEFEQMKKDLQEMKENFVNVFPAFLKQNPEIQKQVQADFHQAGSMFPAQYAPSNNPPFQFKQGENWIVPSNFVVSEEMKKKLGQK